MNEQTAISKVRACLAAIKPDVDIDSVSDTTPLLEERVITSFDVLDLILHMEQASGQPVNRAQLAPGSFRDIATLASVFFGAEPGG
jgi:hypothetical protein